MPISVSRVSTGSWQIVQISRDIVSRDAIARSEKKRLAGLLPALRIRQGCCLTTDLLGQLLIGQPNPSLGIDLHEHPHLGPAAPTEFAMLLIPMLLIHYTLLA